MIASPRFLTAQAIDYDVIILFPAYYAWVIMNHHQAVGRMDDCVFKDFARVGERFIHGALAHGSDLDQVLLGVKENDPERFAVEKTQLGAQFGDCQRAIDRERLSFFA